MPEVAEKNYNDTTKQMKAAADTIAALLAALVRYLEMEAKYAPQRELAKWIKEGGTCCFYTVAGDCKNELKLELLKRQIPYLELSNSTSELIIKAPDIEEIKEINRQININRMNYFQEVDSLEMEDAIARFDMVKDKSIFTLHNLNKYEVEVIKNKCNQIAKGFMVGVHIEDEDEFGNKSYQLSVGANKVVDYKDRKDFCQAYLEAMTSLYGTCYETKMVQLDNDFEFNKNIDELKDSDDVKYIVGANDRNFNRYIELNGKGFIAYTATLNSDGHVIENVEAQVSKNDINYDAELQRQMDKIMDKAVVNQEELSEHLSNVDSSVKSGRLTKSLEEKRASMYEKDAVGVIDSVIKGKMAGQSFDTPADAFAFYTKEAQMIISDVCQGTYKSGYDKDQIDNIAKIYSQITLDVSKYDSVARKLKVDRGEEIHKARKKEKEEVKEVRLEHSINNRE